MLSLDVLAVLIFFALFFLPYCLIGFSRYLVTSNWLKDPERILDAAISHTSAEKGGSDSGTVAPEDRARDNPSPISRNAQLTQHAGDFSLRRLAMGKTSLSASLNDEPITASAPTQHEISVAKMRLLIARHRVSGRVLHGSDIAIRRQAGIDLGRR
jgi:hypothetical protein